MSTGLIRTYANMVYYGHLEMEDVPEPYAPEVEALLATYGTDPIVPDYIHPDTHPATMITQDETHRFVTDAQIATFNAKAEGVHRHNASAIDVVDANNRFTATNVEGVLDELFLNANDIKTKWSSVVGAPLVASDTSAIMQSKTQTIKNTLATNLTAKGQASLGTDSLDSLVAKVASISTGKLTKQGMVNVNWDVSSFSITGLGFRPHVIFMRIIDMTGNVETFKGFASWDDTYDNATGYASTDNSSIIIPTFTPNADGFSVSNMARPGGTANHRYYWTAIQA